jgi:hypothetical protein
MPITVGNLGRLHSVSRRGADVGFSFASSDLVLTPLLPNLVRHTCSSALAAAQGSLSKKRYTAAIRPSRAMMKSVPA